jgi:radical SAM superfamily enzyme YgiQ (UPF0313 family)
MAGSSLILVNPPVSTEPWPPFLQIMTKGLTKNEYFSWPLEHLGLMSIKAYAETQGLPVAVVDGIVEQHASCAETFAMIEGIAREQGPPAVIGFSSMIAFLQNVQLAEQCKAKWPGVVTVFGHDYATLNWRRILTQYPAVDVVCVGEGERVFASVARAVLDGRAPTGVPGSAWRTGDGRLQSAEGELLDLDAIPRPRRDALTKLRPLGFAPAVFSTRGCPFRCTFCTTGSVSATLGAGGYRSKSIGNFVDEIAEVQRDFGADFVTIVDDLFIGPAVSSLERAEQFAQELLRRNLNIQFMIDTRVDAIEEELFRLLHRAGLRRVILGLETGNADQLVTFGKQYTRTPSVKKKLGILMDIGIDIVPGILAFHPTVHPNELRETLELLDFIQYKNPAVILNKVVAYPNTPLYLDYQRRGFLKNDWPVGEWAFQDPVAAVVYDRLARDLKQADFATGRALIESCLAEWEGGRIQVGS